MLRALHNCACARNRTRECPLPHSRITRCQVRAHSSYTVVGKGSGETTKISDNHTFGFSRLWGVSFDDAGQPALHVGPVVWPTHFDTVGKPSLVQGACAWGMRDRDAEIHQL